MNLKQSIQIERGTGIQLNLDNDTEFPSDFASNFLRKNENKQSVLSLFGGENVRKGILQRKNCGCNKK